MDRPARRDLQLRGEFALGKGRADHGRGGDRRNRA